MFTLATIILVILRATNVITCSWLICAIPLVIGVIYAIIKAHVDVNKEWNEIISARTADTWSKYNSEFNNPNKKW